MNMAYITRNGPKSAEQSAVESSVTAMMRVAGWENDGLEIELASHDLAENTFIESREFLANYPNFLVKDVFIGRRSYILGGGLLSPHTIIGRYCSIANSTGIGLNRHNMSALSTGLLPDNAFAPQVATPQSYTVIGSDVWIGFGATIIGGVRIGHGACIAAGAVVTHDVEPYTVVAGVPAKPIRKRFSDKIITALLASKWWTLPESVISLMPYNDIEACVTFLQNL